MNPHMQTFLIINDYSFPIGFHILSKIIEAMPDTSDNKKVFERLAYHPSRNVRLAVCSKEYLGDQAIRHLIESDSPSNIRVLIKCSKSPIILAYMESLLSSDNPDTLELIAGIIDWSEYNDGMLGDEIMRLLAHPIPEIRANMIRNGNTPESMLKILHQDYDPDVRRYVKHNERESKTTFNDWGSSTTRCYRTMKGFDQVREYAYC